MKSSCNFKNFANFTSVPPLGFCWRPPPNKPPNSSCSGAQPASATPTPAEDTVLAFPSLGAFDPAWRITLTNWMLS